LCGNFKKNILKLQFYILLLSAAVHFTVNGATEISRLIETDQTVMQECWIEIRQIRLEMERVVNYHMHFLVVAESGTQLHSVASTPQSACRQHH